jgi:hypothetical protein
MGHKREKVVGGWRILHNEQFHNLYSSSNIIRVIKSTRIRWGTCSMCGRDEKCIQYFWLEKLKGRDHSEDLGIDGKIVLEWFLGKWCEGVDCIGTSARFL